MLVVYSDQLLVHTLISYHNKWAIFRSVKLLLPQYWVLVQRVLDCAISWSDKHNNRTKNSQDITNPSLDFNLNYLHNIVDFLLIFEFWYKLWFWLRLSCRHYSFFTIALIVETSALIFTTQVQNTVFVANLKKNPTAIILVLIMICRELGVDGLFLAHYYFI